MLLSALHFVTVTREARIDSWALFRPETSGPNPREGSWITGVHFRKSTASVPKIDPKFCPFHVRRNMTKSRTEIQTCQNFHGRIFGDSDFQIHDFLAGLKILKLILNAKYQPSKYS